MELADFNIQLWMDLKSNIRKHGVESSKIFNRNAAIKGFSIPLFYPLLAENKKSRCQFFRW